MEWGAACPPCSREALDCTDVGLVALEVVLFRRLVHLAASCIHLVGLGLSLAELADWRARWHPSDESRTDLRSRDGLLLVADVEHEAAILGQVPCHLVVFYSEKSGDHKLDETSQSWGRGGYLLVTMRK